MSDDEDIAALVIDNGSGMCKGTSSCEVTPEPCGVSDSGDGEGRR